jgi:hypothetical protein
LVQAGEATVDRTTKLFRPDTARQYAQRVARPRRVGTAENQDTIDWIAGHLAEAGWHVLRQPFRFAAAGNAVLTMAIGLALALTVGILLAGGRAPGVSALLGALLLGLLALMEPASRKAQAAAIFPPLGQPGGVWAALCRRIGRPETTENIIGHWPGAGAPLAGRPHLLLVAHSDSKSQLLPLPLRMALIVSASAGAIATALCAIGCLAWPQLARLTSGLGALTLTAGLPLLALFAAGAGNRSPGAIDNASGVGLLMHLAEVIAADAAMGVPVTLLVTGAEELGVVGARAFVQAATTAGWLRPDDAQSGLYLLNFDGVGGAGRLTMAGPRGDLADRLETAGQALGVPVGRLGLGGALFDHGPFSEAGVEAATLMIQGRAALRVHTPGDSADLLVDAGFQQAGEVALRVWTGLRRSTGAGR